MSSIDKLITTPKKINLKKWSPATYREIFQRSPIGFLAIDPNHHIVDINKKAAEQFYQSRNLLLGSDLKQLIPNSKQAEFDFFVKDVLLSDDQTKNHTFTFQFHHPEKGKREYKISRLVADNPHESNDFQVYMTLEDVSLQKKLERQLTRDAFYDSLTQLPNRKLFNHYLTDALNRKQRNAQYECAILMLDLDNFNYVNNSYGHKVGEKLLKEVSKRLLEVLRKNDILARIGGDEFVILLDFVPGVSGAVFVAERIQESFNHPFQIEGNEIFTGASMGIMVPTEKDKSLTADEVMRDADTALRRAKSMGRGRYSIFNEKMLEEIVKKNKLLHDIRKGIEEDQFYVVYQPLVSVLDRKVIGFEALLRWEHPRLGNVPPLDFVEIAEDSSLIVDLTDWVIKTVCDKIRHCHDQHSIVPVAVNISMSLFHQTDLPELIAKHLKETGVPAEKLSLEITEQAAMLNSENTLKQLQVLNEKGHSIAIDDFGTGYASLNYLQHFPISTIKIDQSFTRGLGNNSNLDTIVQAIVAMARSMKINVVAEGVETEQQWNSLMDYGCSQVQGYLISHPIHDTKLLDYLKIQLPL